MFFIFSKEKIKTYAVSIFTVAVLIGIANINQVSILQTLANEKSYPINNDKTNEPKITFTLNCEWSAEDIDKILEVLEKNNVKLIFYIVEEWIDKYPEEVKKIYDAGHKIVKV